MGRMDDAADARGEGAERDAEREERTVRAADPSLSPEANRVLTEELRAVVGEDTVEVPADRPHTARERHGARPGLLVGLHANRLVLGITFLAAIVVGAVISLATGSWWFLPLALAAHAVTTIVVVGLILTMTTQTEHLSPTAAARLEDEGVGDPDALFGDLVEEFQPGEGRDTRVTPSSESSPHEREEEGPSRAVGPGDGG